jgi:hypothetical protein
MHGSVTTNRMRSDSIAGASSGSGNNFVPDAIGDVADRDLGPGVLLGGGGGEDVVEEVWGRRWRRRKRWRKGLRGHSKESGQCHQVQANLATFKAAAMHGFLTKNRMRSDSIAGASSGGDGFVPDAVRDVADQDLGPGVVLGGGGGEDVVEEIWWRAWRRRKRWRKCLQGHSKESGQCHQVQANLATFEAATMHGFVTTNRMTDWATVRVLCEMTFCLVLSTRLILYCDILRTDSIAGASSSGNNFVPDAVGDFGD